MEVLFVSDRFAGFVHADNVAEVKRIVAAKINEHIDWSEYKIKVAGIERDDTYVFTPDDSVDGSPPEVRAAQVGVKAA